MNSLFYYIDRAEYRKGKSVLRWKDYNVEIWEDGNTYSHQRLTHRLIKRFAKIDKVNERDIIKLRITALVHDLWEYKEWDKLYGTKTPEDEEKEKKSWLQVAKKIARNSAEIFDSMCIWQNIDSNTSNTLYWRFKIYERLGYIYWAIIAINNNTPDHVWLHWLCHAVMANQYAILDNAIIDYPSVAQFLQEHQRIIQTIFSLGAQHKNSPEKEEAFQRAKELFESRVSSVQ